MFVLYVGGNSQASSKWRKELLPEHTVSTVEVFDPSTGMWTFGPELPNALCGAGQSEETISINNNLLLNSKTYYRHYEIILLI